MKGKSLLLIVMLLFTTSIYSQFNKAGRTSLQFLKIGMGARAVGMGEACIASLDDINGIYWNPATITGIRNIDVSFSYTQWIADLNIMGGAVGINLNEWGVIGISYISLDYGDIPEAFVTSQSGSVDTRTGEYFSGGDLSIGITYARKFTDKLSIGVQLKYLNEDLQDYSSNVIAFDVGSYYETGWKGIRLAMSAQNMSGDVRWLNTKEEAQQSYELPLLFRIGGAIDLLGGPDLFLGGNMEKHKLTLNIDAIHSNDYAERMNMGMEYVFFNMISLRGGYKFNYDEGNITFGIGLNYQIGNTKFLFDYAYVKHDYLESPHRFTLTMAF